MSKALDRDLCLRLLETEGTAAGVHRALQRRGIKVIYGTVRRVLAGPPPERATRSRFAAKSSAGRIAKLPAVDNPALAEKRTIYPHTVVRDLPANLIRFSDAPVDECSTVSLEHPMQRPADAVVCPEQVGKSESCSQCCFCWQSKRRVAFVQH